MLNPNSQLAVLMGNGVSISANQELTIPALTAVIRERFEKIDPKHEAPDRVLARLALRGKETGDPHKDFEAMIGPLDQQKENLDDLRQLAELVGQESKAVRSAIRTIDSFVQRLSRLGKGHALDIIASKSIATYGGQREVVDDFLAAITKVVDGQITIGNLNYDALGLAGLLNVTKNVCDMAWGIRSVDLDLLGDGHRLSGSPLRTSVEEFPRRRIRFVHPHGSLTWLKDPRNGIVYKFDVAALRRRKIWAKWRDGETGWEPQVVLTNQSAKSKMVTQPPFELAYEVLYNHLVQADRWLIAGYSFRDECVNDLLAKAWEARETVPDLLVVSLGDELTKDDVLDSVGYNPFIDPDPSSFLWICRHGVAKAPNCSVWQQWAKDISAQAS